jgi:hypothetical protein
MAEKCDVCDLKEATPLSGFCVSCELSYVEADIGDEVDAAKWAANESRESLKKEIREILEEVHSVDDHEYNLYWELHERLYKLVGRK